MSTAPVICEECGRANREGSVLCLWCGIPMPWPSYPGPPRSIRIEVHYVGGLDRLDEPGPVTLAVDREGFEVREQMPGTRRVRIAAASIVAVELHPAAPQSENGASRIEEGSSRIVIVCRSEDGESAVEFIGDDRAGLLTASRISKLIELIGEGSRP